MPIEIHQACIKRLQEKLEISLKEIKVKNNMFIDQESLDSIFSLDKILPSNENVRKKLDFFIGEHPLFNFVFGSLSKELLERDNFKLEENETLLTDIDDYSNNQEIAKKLIDEFVSL